MSRLTTSIVSAGLLCLSYAANAQVDTPPPTVIRVEPNHVLSDVSRRPLGIDVNLFTDRASLFAPGARPLSEALKDLGVRYVRYPGGEKSQSYLWSVPPFDSSKPELSRTGPKEFWSSQRTYTGPDGKTLINPMSFDEFMGLCHQIGCIPDLVVNHNSYLGPKTTPDATVPTRQQLIDTAAAWVHYANVVKHYNVRYWEIGNETYMKAYNGPRQEPADYGADVHLFAQAMKHEDPGIQVGISGDKYEYYRDVLKVAVADVDYLVIHTYPCCSSYQAYQHTARFDGSVDPARKAIAELPREQRAHIGMALTEVNALDFLPGRKDVNDLGHALLLFEILAQYMAYDPDVEFEEVWNTRWIDNNNTSNPPSIFDVLNNRNELNATGLAMSMLGHGLLQKMVQVTVERGDGLITAYATSNNAGQLRIFVVNRDLTNRSVILMLPPGTRDGQVSSEVLTGEGPDDIRPATRPARPLGTEHAALSVRLPKVSISEFTFAPGQ